ncbi:hypothetical protein BDF20DRAFT_843516 [Mycotypha africana]|uniref:uncharacterized protein n=1 Tax=Mycotypha africana TaxID=64632 RepID=UPI002301499F|nr:uncharacterized protein BDF20DRAFT_843516 [Mycotypha africana]KAI8991240.1 hypothetical protein BDF20DRAFT_843516 [Mycotypha africana]
METILSIKDASGKMFNLLNDNAAATAAMSTVPSFGKVSHQRKACISKEHPLLSSAAIVINKRKFHCLEPGCNKSFTTSGHLARHNRIHTGEKNFHCLYPGCPSRFSRQDNMMQHYRTHLSQKVRRNLRYQQQQQQQRSKKERKITPVKQPTKHVEEASPQLHRHSYLGREHHLSFQPLMATGNTTVLDNATSAAAAQTRRTTTMPSATHAVINRIAGLPYYRRHHPYSNTTPSSPSSTMSNNAHVSRRSRRALSTSSTSSSDSSYFSPSAIAERVPSMSPPPQAATAASSSPLSETACCCPSSPPIVLLEPAHQPFTAPSLYSMHHQQMALKQHFVLPPPIPTFHPTTSTHDKASSLLHLANIVSTFG